MIGVNAIVLNDGLKDFTAQFLYGFFAICCALFQLEGALISENLEDLVGGAAGGSNTVSEFCNEFVRFPCHCRSFRRPKSGSSGGSGGRASVLEHWLTLAACTDAITITTRYLHRRDNNRN